VVDPRPQEALVPRRRADQPVDADAVGAVDAQGDRAVRERGDLDEIDDVPLFGTTTPVDRLSDAARSAAAGLQSRRIRSAPRYSS
jgi:hypothetical protein